MLHYETQLLRKGYHPRNLIRKEERKNTKTTWLGNIIQWTDMDLERVLRATDNSLPRCGQPSDRR